VDEKRHPIICWSKIRVPFVFMEGKAGFMLNQPPSYLLPWSVPGGDGRIAGKALQVEQGNVRKLIANKIEVALSPLFPLVGLDSPGIGARIGYEDGLASQRQANCEKK
jgi:hypothetical protein